MFFLIFFIRKQNFLTIFLETFKNFFKLFKNFFRLFKNFFNNILELSKNSF